MIIVDTSSQTYIIKKPEYCRQIMKLVEYLMEKERQECDEK
jgi:hypothetical protein